MILLCKISKGKRPLARAFWKRLHLHQRVNADGFIDARGSAVLVGDTVLAVEVVALGENGLAHIQVSNNGLFTILLNHEQIRNVALALIELGQLGSQLVNADVLNLLHYESSLPVNSRALSLCANPSWGRIAV